MVGFAWTCRERAEGKPTDRGLKNRGQRECPQGAGITKAAQTLSSGGCQTPSLTKPPPKNTIVLINMTVEVRIEAVTEKNFSSQDHLSSA